ncbi:MAG: DUF721 domain-containing protein [Deltaproteobacteria bacterium]|jgi:hypothetical protein|nr:DUF721 domain-containing protein [Deltaproteobacteria bacterium]
MSAANRYNNDLRSLEEIIFRSLKSGPLRLLAQKQRLMELWPKVVGEEAAANSKPYLFLEGILHVHVTTSVYLDKYRYQLKEWVERYRVELQAPVVERIKLTVGSLTKPSFPKD